MAGGSNCSLDCVVAVTCPSGAKIALLIGNEAYASEIGRLTNPHNGVALLEASAEASRIPPSSAFDFLHSGLEIICASHTELADTRSSPCPIEHERLWGDK